MDLELRETLRPVVAHTYDSMHVVFSNGLAYFEVCQFLQQATHAGVTFSSSECYFRADWQLPYDKKQKGTQLHQLFCPAREASCHDAFKCAASEVLLVWPILHYFVCPPLCGRRNA